MLPPHLEGVGDVAKGDAGGGYRLRRDPRGDASQRVGRQHGHTGRGRVPVGDPVLEVAQPRQAEAEVFEGLASRHVRRRHAKQAGCDVRQLRLDAGARGAGQVGRVSSGVQERGQVPGALGELLCRARGEHQQVLGSVRTGGAVGRDVLLDERVGVDPAEPERADARAAG